MNKKMEKGIAVLAFLPLLPLGFVLSSCFALPIEDPVLPPPVVQAFEPASHSTFVATRGTLQRYRNLSVHIVPIMERPLSFAIPDVHISAIHVEVGDEVQAGDIVAELDREAFVNALYWAERDATAARIDVSQLADRRELSELEAITRGEGIDDLHYQEEMWALQSELTARQLGVAHMREEDERRVLRAPISGTVTRVLPFRPGDTSTLDITVVTISDETRSLFSVTGRETQYLYPGDVHMVEVNREPFEAVVIDPEEWGITDLADNQALLTIYGGDPMVFPARSFASLRLVLEEVRDVVSVPFTAVHEVGDKQFVFVMEDGLRTLREIETGMEGNVGVQVVWGLSEGEVVAVD